MIGRTVGHYRILERLGGGGMGVVYKAEDTKLGRMAAVKFLPPALMHDDDLRARFLHEARAAAMLDHPNICTVYEIGELHGQVWIAMACYDGETLAERIARGPLPLHDAFEIAIQIARGLARAHAAGIVHRDIKPANVIITADRTVKIIDFGVAKLAGATNITRVGSTPGTIAYMAPELLRGEQSRPQSDLWALGAVLHEMLTGRRTFEGEYDQAVTYSILNTIPDPPSRSRPDLPSAVDRIVTLLLTPDLDERYSDAGNVAADLESALTAEQVPGRADSSALRRWGTTGIAAAALAVVALAVALWQPWRRDERAPTQAVAPPAGIVTPTTHEVAVARFENRTQDPSLDALGDMVVDTLTRGREVLPEVTIVPDAGRGGRAPRQPSLRIAGACYLSGDQLRLQAQLLHPDGTLLFTVEPVTGSRTDTSVLLETLRQEVLGTVAAHFAPTLDLNVFTPPTLDAYLEWARGMELFGQDYDGAIRHLRRALEADPDFFEAAQTLYWAWANRGLCDDATRYLDEVEQRDWRLTPFEREMLAWMQADRDGQTIEMVRALRAMHQLAPDIEWVTSMLGLNELRLNHTEAAIALLRQTGTAWFGHGPSNSSWWPLVFLAMALHMNGDYEDAMAVAERGMREFPDNLIFHSRKISELAALGRTDELDEVIEGVLVVNAKPVVVPAPGALWTPGTVMFTAALELRAHGHREDSVDLAGRTVRWFEMQPTEAVATSDLVTALVLAGNPDEARAIATRRLAANPNDWKAIAQAGALAARLGDRDEAMRLGARLTPAVPPCFHGEASYRRAGIAAQLGDRDDALRLLKQAFAEGYRLDLTLHRDIDLEPLRNDPEFIELARPKA